MSEYELRSRFPFNKYDFATPQGSWHCALAEVSDLRPQSDRLAWYLTFRPRQQGRGREAKQRNLEILTSANLLLNQGFGADLENRIEEWLNTNEVDGRREWLDY